MISREVNVESHEFVSNKLYPRKNKKRLVSHCQSIIHQKRLKYLLNQPRQTDSQHRSKPLQSSFNQRRYSRTKTSLRAKQKPLNDIQNKLEEICYISMQHNSANHPRTSRQHLVSREPNGSLNRTFLNSSGDKLSPRLLRGLEIAKNCRQLKKKNSNQEETINFKSLDARKLQNYVRGGYPDQNQQFCSCIDLKKFQHTRKNFMVLDDICKKMRGYDPIDSKDISSFTEPTLEAVINYMQQRHKLGPLRKLIRKNLGIIE